MKILIVNETKRVDTVADNIEATPQLRAEKADYIAGVTRYYTGDYAVYKNDAIVGYIGHLTEQNSTVTDVDVVPSDIFQDDGNGNQIQYTYEDGIYTRIQI